MSPPLDAFLTAAPERLRGEDPAELLALLEPLYERARSAWPDVPLEPAAFFAHLGARLGEAATAAQGLAELRTDDLYLACACLQRHRAALETFDRALRGELMKATASVGATDAEREDVIQSLRESFFMKGALAKYSGRGQLRAWVRTTATRAALAVVDARNPRAGRDEEQILERVRAGGDTELDLIRGHFKVELERAFEQAVAALSPADRGLLAQHYVDGMSLDQLAVHQGVHRATVARWLARVRRALLDDTRARLRESLKIDAAALESLFRFARSRLDLSIHRILVD